MKRKIVVTGLILAMSASAYGLSKAQRPVPPAPVRQIAHPSLKPFLMPIEDVFFIRGQGAVVTGRIETGIVQAGDEVEIVGLGSTRPARVTRVEMFRKILVSAQAGDYAGITLAGFTRDQLQRGQVLARPGSIATCTEFNAMVTPLPTEQSDHFQYYFRTVDVAGRIAFAPGGRPVAGRRSARIAMTAPIAMKPGQPFTVRQGGRTLGAGTVTSCLARGDAGVAANPGPTEIGPRVRKIVSDLLGVEPTRVTMSARFKEDLGADSLDFVELVMAWEEEFGIEIGDAAAARIRTVGDAEKIVKAALLRPAG